MLYLEPTTIGVNFSDFFNNQVALSHDHINSIVNPSHVLNFIMIMHPYTHNLLQGFENRLKFGIRFFFINGSYTDWLYDTKDSLNIDFERLKKNLCS